ncbi:MAG TPA: type II secretion system protein [Candidatus Angelobacter sp.]|nr:type II secretion system protein [Candidatus Angelobacter sp.]
MKVSRAKYGIWSTRVGTGQCGVTLLEMIVVITILLILMGAAVPVVKVSVRREREVELKRALWQMREAIDRYKDAADKNLFRVKLDSQGYPPDLDTLVNGEEIAGGKKLRFLRHIPIDPMTGNADWGLRSMQDDPQSESWGGQNVFDVYSKSTGTGLNGTKYKDW